MLLTPLTPLTPVFCQELALHVWDLEKTYQRWASCRSPKRAVRGETGGILILRCKGCHSFCAFLSLPFHFYYFWLNHSVKYLEALHIFRFHSNIWIHNDSYINIPSRNRKSAGTGNSSLRLDWAPCCSSQQSGQTQSSVVGGRYDTTLDRTHGRQSKMHWNLAAQGHDTLTRNCHRTHVNSTAKKRNNMKHCETTTWTQLATSFFFQTKDAARWISNKAGLDASISLVSFHGAQMLWDGSHACCPISIAWHVHSKKLWLFAYSAVVLCATGG